MDDVTVTATSVPRCRWVLRGLERLATLARMTFKLAKCRSLVPKYGESGGKVLLPFRWTPNSIGVREACDEHTELKT